MMTAKDRGASLCVSVVTYRVDPDELVAMLSSLQAALNVVRQHLAMRVGVVVVDNGQQGELVTSLCDPFREALGLTVIANTENRGYGSAHNQALARMPADYHLLMNPDVVMQPDCLLHALQYLAGEQDVVALIPEVRDLQGSNQYLCKRYPSVLDLALRGFAPAGVRRLFNRRLARYECRAMVDRKLTSRVELISGCYMLCKGEALRQAGGFNERFFMYFEDFALSRELNKLGKVMYFPQVSIVHYGGHAARKGWQHIRYFARSALTFFNLYGWKLF